MDKLELFGVFLVVYAIVVIAIATRRPDVIWDMVKIKFLRKMFGEQGTIIIFFAFAGIVFACGVWLII